MPGRQTDPALPADESAQVSDTAATPARSLSLAIVSGNSQAAEHLWSALGSQLERKGKLTVVRGEPERADAALYLIRGEDICDRNSAQRTVGNIRRSPAQIKLAVESPQEGNSLPDQSPLFHQVLASLDMDKSAFLVGLPDRQKLEKKSRKETPPQHDVILQLQAKAIAKILMSESATGESEEAESPSKRSLNRGNRQDEAQTVDGRAGLAGPGGKRKKERRRKGAIQTTDEASEQADSPRRSDGILRVATVAEVGVARSVVSALKEAFAGAAGEVVEASEDAKADLIVIVPEQFEIGTDKLSVKIFEVHAHRRSVKIFVSLPQIREGEEKAHQNLLRQAAAHDGIVVEPAGVDGGWLPEAATAIRNALAFEGLSGERAPNAGVPRAGISELAALAANPAELFAALILEGKSLPPSLRAPLDPGAMEAFVESKALLRSGRQRARERTPDAGIEDEIFKLDHPIDWTAQAATDKAQRNLLGLEFLSPVLSYWFVRANNSKGEDVAKIDSLLKQKSITASFLLNRAGEIIADFAAIDGARLRAPAWTDATAAARARAFMLFLLCAKIASKRRIKFNDAHCGPALSALLDTLEWLRHSDFRKPISLDAIEQDAFLATVAGPLAKTQYGAALICDTLESAKRYQFDPGLSSDGVWRGTFSDHCSVLSALAGLLRELQPRKIPNVGILADAIRRMGPFAAAMLKSDGQAPALDDNPPKSFSRSLTLARAVLRNAEKGDAAPRPVDESMEKLRAAGTHVFPASGYLVSHSERKPHPKSSQLVFHVFPETPAEDGIGGLSLFFGVGPTDLIIGGGASGRKVREDVREASRLDQGAHTSIRINGDSYDRIAALRGIALKGCWGGDDWAAAAAANCAYDEGQVTRTAIHLKKHNALIVVDELRTKAEADAEFEQFWHFGPQFSPHAEPLHFAAENDGALAIAFDGNDQIAIERGDASNPLGWTRDGSGEIVPNYYLRRSRRTGHGVMASLFRWACELHPVFINLSINGHTWTVRGKGADFDASFTFAEPNLVRSGS
jgi:hypothetical protein